MPRNYSVEVMFADVPDDVTRDDLQTYVDEAVHTWCKNLNSGGQYDGTEDEDNPSNKMDPLFNIDRHVHSISVPRRRHIRRSTP